MHRYYQLDHKTNKRHLLSIEIIYNDGDYVEHITHFFGETIQFKEELNLFTNGDLQNSFVKPVSRKIEKKEVYSLELNLKNKKLYISRAEAKTMAMLIFIAYQGFSLAKMYEHSLTDAFGLHLLDIGEEDIRNGR